MSNQAGQQASYPIIEAQEQTGRRIREDGVVVNMADSIDLSGVALNAVRDRSGRDVFATTFGQLAVSNKDSQITEQFPYGAPGTGVVSEITGSGYLTTSNSLLRFGTTTADGTAWAESLQALRYIPGSMAYAFYTVTGFKPSTNVKAFVGIFDDEDGFAIGTQDAKMCILYRRFTDSAAVDVIINQEDWNLDTLDGNGGSGLNIDFELGQVYAITYGYLGFAPILFSIKAPNDNWVAFHRIEYPNTSKQTHLSQPYLPFRGEVDNTGSGEVVEIGIGSLDVGVFNGGKTDSASRPEGVNGGALLATPATISGPTMVIALRGISTFSGRRNKISALLNTISWATDASVKAVTLNIIKEPTVTVDGTWTQLQPASVIEYSIDTTFDLTSGFETGIGITLAKDSSTFQDVSQINTLIRRSETIVIVADSTNGIVSDLFVGIKELL